MTFRNPTLSSITTVKNRPLSCVLSQEIWRKFPPLKDSFTSREQYANWHNLRKDLTACTVLQCTQTLPPKV